jgi:transcriptional regulator with XRE-family HTH domain
MDRYKFSQRIKNLRIESGMTQAEFGMMFNLSKQSINDIENCRNVTSIEKLIAIADHFDVSLDYLVGRTDDPRRF